MSRKPIAGIDYTLSEQGRKIFTARFLLSLGYCCRMDCLNCPYQAKSLVYDDPCEESIEETTDPSDSAYI